MPGKTDGGKSATRANAGRPATQNDPARAESGLPAKIDRLIAELVKMQADLREIKAEMAANTDRILAAINALAKRLAGRPGLSIHDDTPRKRGARIFFDA